MNEYDAVIIGANIRGLVAASVLHSFGYRVIVVDRASAIGGADGSFVTAAGNLFDHGLHVLDETRSELATRLFVKALDGQVRRLTLRRGIVLRGSIMPYAPEPHEMPRSLADLLPSLELVDDIGDDLPTRERLSECYGTGFADLIFGEVLPSYPSESRHLQFGVDEARLLTNIYPWFFPRGKRSAPSADESRAFHDRLRTGTPQAVLYPAEGGFGSFAHSLADGLIADGVELVLGATDLEVVVGPAHRAEYVATGDRCFAATRYFWASAWPGLCAVLGLPCQDVATDRVILGSLRLDRAPNTDHHELLVGDPSLWINRIHFPSAFRGTTDHLMQVEFAVPIADATWSEDPDDWRTRWVDDLRRLGILDTDHTIEDFDVRSFVMHFNGFGAEGEALRDADPTLLDPDSNVHPVVPSMANLNLNRYVPRVVRDVTRVVSATDD